jgi:hypothetical protein
MKPTVTIEGVEYVVETKGANHGFQHWHDDTHEDGTPGQPAHHHHDEKCQWQVAMLKPVTPIPTPLDIQIHITETHLDRLYEKEG